MEMVVRSVLLLMLTLALIGQYPASAKITQQDAERIKNVLERLRSMVPNSPSPAPMIEDNKAEVVGDAKLTEENTEKIQKLLERLRSVIENAVPHPQEQMFEAKVDGIMDSTKLTEESAVMNEKETIASPAPAFEDSEYTFHRNVGGGEKETIASPAPAFEDSEYTFHRNVGGGGKISEEDDRKINNLLERLRSVMMQQEVPPSSPPVFSDEDNEAQVEGPIDNPGGTHHSIRPDSFGVNYVAGYMIEAAPSSGRVTLDLIDDTNQKILIHVDARYNWYGNHHILVLNNWDGNWKTEMRPSGFDFTAGKASDVRVKAETNGFQVSQNGKNIALFPYRSGVTVTSLTRVRIRSEGNTAAQDASLGVKFH